MTKELEALKRIKNFLGYNYCSVDLPNELKCVEQALQRLEQIDNAKPSEALECLEKLKGMEISSMPFSDEYGTQEVDLNDIRKVGSQLNTDFREYTDAIKQALLKSQEMKEESYVIYCINNYHNVYMDYRGEPCIYQEATIFNDKLEAHKFLREKGNNNDYYRWSVFNVKDLSEDQKHRQE